MARKRQALRCTANNRQGRQCGRYASLGSTVCHIHGGSAPQVRQAARLRARDEYAAHCVGAFSSGRRPDARRGPQGIYDPFWPIPPSRREREAQAEAGARHAEFMTGIVTGPDSLEASLYAALRSAARQFEPG